MINFSARMQRDSNGTPLTCPGSSTLLLHGDYSLSGLENIHCTDFATLFNSWRAICGKGDSIIQLIGIGGEMEPFKSDIGTNPYI